MEEVIEKGKLKLEIKSEEKSDIKKEKKKFLIFGYSFWRLLAYFIIYSFAGYVVETLFCIIKDGVWESRQSFMFGPFCGIYGLGAVIILLTLKKLKHNFHTLFISGAIVGSAIEYAVSWIGELLFNVRWWDYSGQPLNVNGRICALYAIFWGMLSCYLVLHLNPKVDKIIDWIKQRIKSNVLRVGVIGCFIILVIDALISSYGTSAFMIRTIINYDINVANKDKIQILYDEMYGNEKVTKFIDKHFNDQTMIMIFPRLKVEDVEGNVIYFSELMPNLKTYYLRIWDGSDEWKSRHNINLKYEV